MLLGDTEIIQERIASKNGQGFTITEATWTASDDAGSQVGTGPLAVDSPGSASQVVSFGFTPSAEGNYYVRLTAIVGGAPISFDRTVWVIRTAPGIATRQARYCWRIARELGKGDDKCFYELLNEYWGDWFVKSFNPMLQVLYVKRQAIEYLLGNVWQDVDFGEADVKESLDQYTKHLQGLYDSIGAQIKTIETNLAGTRGAAVGQMTTTAPIQTHGLLPDPNWRGFRGDPLVPAFIRWWI